MLSVQALIAALRSIGNAGVYTAPGFTTVASQFVPLGIKEGNIGIAFNEEVSNLTAPEQTGPAIHEMLIMGLNPVVTVPFVIGDPALYATLSSTGSASAGSSIPQPSVKSALAIIPHAEVGGGLSYDGTTWARLAGQGVAAASGAAAEPTGAWWFWRGVLRRPDNIPYSSANGGKVIGTVSFQVLFDAARPEGHKLFSQGSPVAAMPTFRL